MTAYRACLVDVFETVLSVDFVQHNNALADRAGVEPEAFAEAIGGLVRSVMDGSRSVALALDEALRRCGSEVLPDRLDELVLANHELLRELVVLHDDTVPFLESLRARGVRTAFVSNCAENTRPLLEALGLAELVDELVLSCEVGAAKPDRAIFDVALDRLGIAPGEALFVDDQQVYCDGASAVGVRALLIDRSGGSGDVATLTELASYF